MTYLRSRGVLLVALLALGAGCGSAGDIHQASGGVGGGSITGATSSSSVAMSASSGATSAASTGSGAGGAGTGGGAPGVIRHVVVIVKENHTFDNYFGSFPGVEGTTT